MRYFIQSNKWILALILFFLFLACATLYTIRYTQSQLPYVQLDRAEVINGTEGNRVPTVSIFADHTGKQFVLIVRQQPGPWGMEYYCESKQVRILSESDAYVVVRGLETTDYPIITEYSIPPQAGEQVRLTP